MSESIADAQIQQFIEGETQKQRFQVILSIYYLFNYFEN